MADVTLLNSIGKQINLQAIHASAVVASDSSAFVASTIYVGSSGNVAVTTVGGEVTTFISVATGTILPILCTKVMATNTTASAFVILF